MTCADRIGKEDLRADLKEEVDDEGLEQKKSLIKSLVVKELQADWEIVLPRTVVEISTVPSTMSRSCWLHSSFR